MTDPKPTWPEIAGQLYAENGGYADLEDAIAEALSDSLEMDWTTRDGARAVMPVVNAELATLRKRVRVLEEALHNPRWDGLARSIMLTLDMGCKTPRQLFERLEWCDHAIPQWLRDEPEMQALDHVISNGTRCVILWNAMISDETRAALKGGENE